MQGPDYKVNAHLLAHVQITSQLSIKIPFPKGWTTVKKFPMYYKILLPLVRPEAGKELGTGEEILQS